MVVRLRSIAEDEEAKALHLEREGGQLAALTHSLTQALGGATTQTDSLNQNTQRLGGWTSGFISISPP